MKYPINEKNMPNKSQGKFYNFVIGFVMPRVLNAWHRNKGQEKYFFDKPGMHQWYVHKIKESVYKSDWVSVIIFSIIILYRKEKIDG
jgi:hypothetical protein